MKKTLSIILVLLLCITVFSGCGSKKTVESGASSAASEGEDNDGFDLNLGSDEEGAGNSASGGTGASGSNGTNTSGSGNANTTGKITDLKGREIRVNVLAALNPNDKGDKVRIDYAKTIEKKYNCKITFVPMMNESAGNHTIKNSVAGSSPIVDLWYQNDASEIFLHYQAGYFINLSDLNVFDFDSPASPYKKGPQDIFRFGSAYYGVVSSQAATADPLGVNVMFFNKKLLNDYGISDDLYALQDSNKWTWDKFKELADKFNINSSSNADVTACYDDGALLYNSLLHTRGTDWVKKENGILKFNGNDKLAQEALEVYKKYVSDGTVTLGSDPKKYGTDPRSDAAMAGTGMKYSFIKGQVAFTVYPLLGLEWSILKNPNTTPDIQKNYGVLMLPKVKSSDKYTFVSSISGQSGYAIPIGVKNPAEVATILNELQTQPYDDTSMSKDLHDMRIKQNLPNNNSTKDGISKTGKLIIDSILFDKVGTVSYIGLCAMAKPNLVTDDNGWHRHVYNIATGKEAMGSVLTSVTDTYNTTLGSLFKQR